MNIIGNEKIQLYFFKKAINEILDKFDEPTKTNILSQLLNQFNQI